MTLQKTKLDKVKAFLQKGCLGLFVLAVLVFVGFKLYPLIHGPAIDVATLVNGETVSDPMIRVSGIAAFTQNLVVDGKELALAPDGSFDENLVLNPGYNVISIDGTDRFGKSSHTTYAMVLDETNPPSLSMNVK